LPPRCRNGQTWPAYLGARWDAWRRIPHAALWRPGDWEFALDTIELVARTAEDDAPVSLISEIRLRERTPGTTWDAGLSQRIRYVALTTDDGPGARGQWSDPRSVSDD
jgi:hypothetical protein